VNGKGVDLRRGGALIAYLATFEC